MDKYEHPVKDKIEHQALIFEHSKKDHKGDLAPRLEEQLDSASSVGWEFFSFQVDANSADIHRGPALLIMKRRPEPFVAKYEYSVHEISKQLPPSFEFSLQQRLHNASNDGWNLVSFQTQSALFGPALFIMERPVSLDPAPPPRNGAAWRMV